MPPPAASRWPFAALTLILLFGAALRFWQANESLWLDELHTAWCALGTFAEVAPRAAIGNQSPPFFWLEWLLVQVFAASELTVRLPSLVAGALLPIALHCLVSRWTRQPWLGVAAAWLVAIDPLQLYYATEARPYALVQLLAALHMGLLAELLDRPRFSLHVLFVAIGALIFHLHYTAALLFPAEIAAISIVTVIDRRDRECPPEAPVARNVKPLIADFLAIAALCLPAMPHLLAIFERRANWAMFVERPEIQDLITLFPWTWAALVVLAGPAFRSFKHVPTQNDDRRVASVLTLCWLLIPLTIAFVLARTDIARLFFPRYLIASAPAAIVMAVLAVGFVPWARIRGAVGVAVAVAALINGAIPAASQLAADGRLIPDRRGDWRSAIAHFNRRPDRDKYPVLVTTQLIESEALRGSVDAALAEYCLYPVHSLYPIDADPAITIPLPRTNPGRLARAVSNLVNQHGGAWLVFAGGADAAEAAGRDLIQSVQGPRSDVQSQEGSWSTQRDTFGTVHIIRLRRTDR